MLEELRADVWRYLSQSAQSEDALSLEAAALLQMRESDVRALARTQFVLSDEVAALLKGMPALVRRLATTTVREEEWSLDRVRGPRAMGADVWRTAHHRAPAPIHRLTGTAEHFRPPKTNSSSMPWTP